MVVGRPYQEKNKWWPRWPIVALVAAALAVIVLGGTGYSAAGNVHVAVYAWTASNPGQDVPVIVQMDKPDEGVIEANGGVVTHRLDMISSVAAHVPAASLAHLAGSDGVRWISLDAPVAATALTPPAPAFDVASACTSGSAASFTWQHTVGNGPNRLLLVDVSIRSNLSQRVLGVQFAGQALTLAGYIANGSNVRAETWRLINPPTGANDVVVTLTAAASAVCGASSFSGVDQITPLGSKATGSGNSTTPSKAVSSVTNQVVHDTLAALNGVTAKAGKDQTELWNQAVGATVGGAASTKAGASSVTMSWTLGSAQPWALLVFPIKPAPLLDPSYLATAYPLSVNAPAVWDNSPSRTGRGVTVAVVDTGITSSSSDFIDASGKSRLAFNVAVNPNNPTDSGTVPLGSAQSTTTLQDISKSWVTNQWARATVTITGGTGAGQTRTVASNTNIKLTVSVAWTTTPASGSAYTITSLSDGYGHGTHIAGTIGGDGSAISGKYMGIAPDAKLGNVKIADNLGNATLSDLIAGLQWVSEHKAAYNIRVVNLSLQSGVAQSYKTDPLDAAVEFLWFNGIVVVTAAGNLGSAPDAVSYAPANDPFAIVVGAVDDMGTKNQADDQIPDWSSDGYTQDGFYKPDIVAPGRHIISDIDTTSYLARTYPSNLVDSKYFRMSGTSMSAAVVSGVVALMLEQNPGWSPGQVKYVLRQTARPLRSDRASKEPLADGATFYTGTLASTDAGLVPSYLIGGSLAEVGAVAYVLGSADPVATAQQVGLDLTAVGATSLDTVDWSAIQWSAINWSAIKWDVIQWDSIKWNAIQWDSIKWNAIQWDSISWDAIKWSAIQWSSIKWSSIKWSSIKWSASSIDFNSIKWNSIKWNTFLQ